MAGSQPDSQPASPFTDPILVARLEAIELLAQGLSDRVAVMDRAFNVVYANEQAWASERPESPRAKCYEAFANRQDPCGRCPATKVFESPEVQAVSCGSGRDGASCGMRQAFPLTRGDGTVASMLVLFEPAPRTAKKPAPEAALPPTLRDRVGELIGRSSVMRHLLDMTELVADSSATVLIQGESGTGKELLARTIHGLGQRSKKPFIVVDCGALPESLLESELFGHRKGAFTGAVANKRGLFEEADGGTIFLDEIADTTPVFQAKLLRVLQEREIKPVGGTAPIKIDVRVISATNKDLTQLVKAKAFRQDLYYRLAVLPLYVPPLRDRREDIPLLVEQFVAHSCARHHQPIRRVSTEVMQALSKAAWPGNVRELQHCIERAVVTTTGPSLACDHVPLPDLPSGDEPLRVATKGAVAQTESARIVDALKKAAGNRSETAKLLKISRASLYNKLRLYSIQ